MYGHVHAFCVGIAGEQSCGLFGQDGGTGTRAKISHAIHIETKRLVDLENRKLVRPWNLQSHENYDMYRIDHIKNEKCLPRYLSCKNNRQTVHSSVCSV